MLSVTVKGTERSSGLEVACVGAAYNDSGTNATVDRSVAQPAVRLGRPSDECRSIDAWLYMAVKARNSLIRM